MTVDGGTERSEVKRLSLREVTRDNWRAALELAVLPEQQRFVAACVPIAAIALAKAYIRAGGLVWVPYAFFRDEQMVGLVALACDPDSADNYWLFHFFIDHRFQRQGLGTQALQLVLQSVRASHPSAHVLQLTVHPENIPAQRLYRQAGFTPTGEIRDDEPVYQLALSIE
jgi:diamine N-acetyltransferase